MIVPTPHRRFADERGQSLVLTLLVLFVLAIVLSTVIIFTSSNQRNSAYQRSAQTASTLAEAGLNNAISVLANPNNSPYLETAATSTQQAVLPDNNFYAPTSKAYSGGTSEWWGVLNHSGSAYTWTVSGRGTVTNPTGPGAANIVKTVTASINVNPPVSNSYQVGVWNTVYSPYGPTAGCDTTIGQGINIAVPVYVGGNLCMGQNATITKPTYVGGFLFFNNKQGSIGSNASRINSAHVGSYCQVQNTGGQVNPCKSEPVQGNQPNTNIWVTGAPNNLSGVASDFVGITAPKICWSGAAAEVASGACTNTPPGGWYTFASPGPNNPCNAQSTGSPLPVFESAGNTVMDQSVASVFNLTPTTSYSCLTSQGQLSWDATTRTLTVVGTVFFDGSITMTTSGNQPMIYKGTGSGGACTQNADCQAVIYASGDISINSEKLCAVLNGAGTDCSWNTWDPNKKLLIFASNGPTGITVGPSQTSFQGGLYATNTVATGQSAVTEGPLVSGTKTVVLGQQFGGTFPPITIAPFSIQQQPGGFTISPPTNFSYSG